MRSTFRQDRKGAKPYFIRGCSVCHCHCGVPYSVAGLVVVIPGVERLQLIGVVDDEHWDITTVLDQVVLMLFLQIAAPL